MWILKNSKELSENLKAQSLHSVSSINFFDFSTLYTTIPYDKLKSKLKETIDQCFVHKTGNRRFQYVVIGYTDTYFVQDHSDAPQKYSDTDVIKMLEYLIDNIFMEFGRRIFQQKIGLPMSTNCAPLLADLFLYSYKAEFVQESPQSRQETPCKTIQFHIQIYIYDVLFPKKTQKLQSIWNSSIHVNLKLRKQWRLQPPPDTWVVISSESLLLGFTTNGMTSIFPLLTFHS